MSNLPPLRGKIPPPSGGGRGSSTPPPNWGTRPSYPSRGGVSATVAIDALSRQGMSQEQIEFALDYLDKIGALDAR